ncbi:hypothetical protein OIU74_021274, partial [Salix koriyanagi]
MASATALAIGGSFLSAFLQVLFDRMASREVLGFFKERKLNDRLLRKLKVLMIAVNGVLDDAEEKQIAKPAVEMWVNELKDAVYEADDLLDEISYEALRSEVEGGSRSSADQRVKEEIETKLGEIVDALEYLSLARGSKILVTTRIESVASVRATVSAHRLQELTADDCFGGCLQNMHLMMEVAVNFLRTFLPLSEAWLRNQINVLPVSRVWPRNEIDNKVTHDLLPRLTRLRVLSLVNYSNVAELPDSMGKLKHLRYLNLSATSIKRLPEVVSAAYHLQTLILENCKELVELPDSVGHLKHLLYASLKGSKIKMLPESMSTLYSLQTLVLEDCRHLVRLPHSIGNLKRLRYVTLKGTTIKKLPASMGGLCDLQTLILRLCIDLIELPDDMGRLINLSHLDIEGTKLSKMPQHMGKLTKLQNLSDFFLGKDTGSSIQELGKLQHLQGGLNIWNLQNVGSAPDALQDNMKVKGMKHLKSLNLMWDGDPNDSGHVRHVLDKLEPDVNMEYLFIYGYGGTRFADWVGDSSFSRIVSMELSRCKYCTSLPPLGQLGSLKELTMPEWREWISDRGMQAFPCLQKLCISGCPYLRKVLSNHRLPSLTTLEIEGCRQLLTSFPRCPIIDEVKLDDGFGFRHLLLGRLPSGMHSLEADRCYSTGSIPKEIEQIGCFLTTLEEIEMENCDSLKCFQLELFPRLKILRISKCSNLEFICEHEGPLEDLTSLNSLKIWECPKLVSFPKGGLPASCLTELQLFDCANLKSLPVHMDALLPSLEDLRLFLLPKLEVFPEG